MRQRVLDLIKSGNKLFEVRFPILNLWQTMAENFYPMRANFTRVRYISEEFASFLMTGRPAMAHRELSNAFSSMLRPYSQQWFHIRTEDENINADAGIRAFLDQLSDRLRRVIYDRNTLFTKATKEADKDFAAFGNAVISIEPRRDFLGLLYRCWHLRDVAWAESSEGKVNQVHNKRKIEAHQLIEMFPKTVSQDVKNLKNEDKFKPIEARHIVIPTADYDLPPQKTKGRPFVSIYVDPHHETILEEVPKNSLGYVIPRWETVSDHQYGYSPAAVLGLPDSRMLQQMTLTLLEYGQKVVDPPMVAVGEAINGAVNLYAGGITYADADYDERMGEVLRPLTLRDAGLNWGDKREESIHAVFQEIFYLSQIQFPTLTKEMTASESSQIYQEFVRRAIPLFEPITNEYNSALCFESFALARQMGAFGPPQAMPQVLQNQSMRFDFDTPLQAAEEKTKIANYQEALQLAVMGAQADPNVLLNFNTNKAYRDAATAAGGADWLLPPKVVAALAKQKAQVQAATEAAQQVAHGADVATRVAGAAQSAGNAAQSLQQAGLV